MRQPEEDLWGSNTAKKSSLELINILDSSLFDGITAGNCPSFGP